MNEFHVPRKVKVPSVASAGLDSGSTSLAVP
jgi:hypothetical protein